MKKSKIPNPKFWIFVFLLSACASREIKTTGFIEGEEFLVSVPVAGAVDRLFVREGDVVVRDQLLARIDTEKSGTDYYKRLKQVYEAGGISKKELDQSAQIPDFGDEPFYRTPRARILLRLPQSKKPREGSVEEIKAPSDGIVTKRFVQEGQSVETAHPAFLITNLEKIYLRAAVTQKELGKVKLGQEAEVSIDGFPPFKGRLVQIAEEPEFSPTEVLTQAEAEEQAYLIRIELANHEGIFKPGMPAKASLHDASHP